MSKRPEVLCKKAVLKNFSQRFFGQQPQWSSFLVDLQALGGTRTAVVLGNCEQLLPLLGPFLHNCTVGSGSEQHFPKNT